MNISLFFSIIRSSLLLIVFTLLVTIATAAYLTKSQPRLYKAATKVIVSFQDENPFENSRLPAQLSSSYMATQLDIIRSNRVALSVVDELDILNKPDFLTKILPPGTNPSSATLDWVAAQLNQNRDVSLGRDNSRVVTISYVSADPEFAAEMANAFADAYMRVSLDLNQEPVRRNADWFDEQLKVLRQRLEDAEARLTTFQQENGIIALDERLDTETARLAELSKNLVAAQSDLYDVQSRKLGTNHPEYQRALERERSLGRSVERQKNRLLELKEQRDTLGALAREVANEQANYENTLQTSYQARLESQFNQTNIAVLSPAVAPGRPFSPNIALNMISAVFLGLFLALAIAVLIELMHRRIRTEDDVSEILGLPVLESI